MERWGALTTRLSDLAQPSSFPRPGSSGYFEQASELIARWAGGLRQFRAWCAFRRHAAHMNEGRLGPVVRAFEEGTIAAKELEAAAECSLLGAWVAAVRDANPLLRGFDGPARDRTVERFRDLDRQHVQLGALEIVRSLERRLPESSRNAPDRSEPGVLARELRKKTRHLPIRKLLSQIPNLLVRLKPCLMMSPLSVAQFLPAGERRFDLVVFDEASQICTHDAIGAIGRGSQVVVVGDSHQLPPTAFFQKAVQEEETPDEDDVVELESILDEALGCGMPQQSLGWHYRSRHHGLIQFSNEHFYNNDLSVFPAARSRVLDLGVRWHHVPNGV